MATTQMSTLTIYDDVEEYRSTLDSLSSGLEPSSQSDTAVTMLEDIEEYINSLSRLGEDNDGDDDEEVRTYSGYTTYAAFTDKERRSRLTF